MREETLGSYLKKIRLEKKNIGLTNFAKMVGIKPSQYSNIEHDREKISDIKILNKICECLDIKENSDEKIKIFKLFSRKIKKKKEKIGIIFFATDINGNRLSDEKLIELNNHLKK